MSITRQSITLCKYISIITTLERIAIPFFEVLNIFLVGAILSRETNQQKRVEYGFVNDGGNYRSFYLLLQRIKLRRRKEFTKFDVAPAKDDYVTVAVVGGKAYVYATEKVEGAISYVKGDDKVTIDGTTYEANEKYATNFALTTKTATVYVDQYGFVSAYEGPSTSGDKSVVVTKVYQTLEDGELINMFKGVTSNGETMDSKWEATAPIVSTVYTYADADDNGLKELTAVSFTPGTVNTGNIANDNVVYIGNAALSTSTKKVVVKDDTTDVYGFFTDDVKVIFVDNGKATVADGTQKVASGSEQFAVLKKSADDATYYIDTLYVIGAPVASSTTSDDIVFVAADSTSSIMKTVDGKDKTYYVYTAYLNGEKVDDFYATTSITSVKGFYTVDIQDASGAYVLAGNGYNSSNDSETLAVTAELTIYKDNVTIQSRHPVGT